MGTRRRDRRLYPGVRPAACCLALLETEAPCAVVQVAAVQPQFARRGRPVAVVPRDGLEDRLALEALDALGERALLARRRHGHGRGGRDLSSRASDIKGVRIERYGLVRA